MIEERIGGIITNLRPKGVLPNQYGPPQNLSDRMTLEQIPGLSVAVVSDGEIEWARGFGVKEYGQHGPVTTETLFEAASITKTIFTAALMKLASEGVLDLDEDVNSYLKSWRVPKNGNWQPIVTLRQSLSHTAGLNIHGVVGYARGDSIPTLVQVLNGEPPSIQPPITVDGIPGLQNRYSTGGYAIAEQIVIDVTGRSVAELVRELVLEPLEMGHSSMDEPLPSRFE
jgi:CubicO group peptidase (beta-lactamase class C family)